MLSLERMCGGTTLSDNKGFDEEQSPSTGAGEDSDCSAINVVRVTEPLSRQSIRGNFESFVWLGENCRVPLKMNRQTVALTENRAVVIVNKKIRNATPFIVGIALVLAIVSLVFSVSSAYYFNKSDKYALKTDIASAEKAALAAAVTAIVSLLVLFVALGYAVYSHAGSKPLWWVGGFAVVILIGQIVAAGKLDTTLKARVENPHSSSTDTSTPPELYWTLALSILGLLLLLAVFLISFNQAQNMRRAFGVVNVQTPVCQ